MTTLFAGGKPPEIVHLASFEFQKFADEGWLEDLAPFIRAGGLDLNGWAGQDACMWKGKPVCIMMLYFGNIFAYNEELLTKEGIAPPTNWAEYIAAARKLTKDLNGDGIPDECQTPPCSADFNADGGVDGADIEAFFVAFAIGEPEADVNADGGVDGGDVESFFVVWEAGGC